MRIKLVEYNTDNAGYEETGTCEFCMDTQWCDNPVFTFELGSGVRIRVIGYYWDWGDYSQVRIENIVDFGAWIAETHFTDDVVVDTSWLFKVVTLYNEWLYEKEYK